MGQDGKVRKSTGRLTPAEFQAEIAADQAREDRLFWWELVILAVIAAFAALCYWLESR